MEYLCINSDKCAEDELDEQLKEKSSCSQSSCENIIEMKKPQVVSIIAAPDFIPPTNQASIMENQEFFMHRKVNHSDDTMSANIEDSKSLPILKDDYSHSPCLPVSKGNIKKMAQTRFVNSSPQSYRLMPASVESSDMTSFIEKTPHKYALRASFMLDVAELWELSKHSELECMFTNANSYKETSSDNIVDEVKHRRPICHSSIVPAQIHCPWGTSSRRISNDLTDEIEVKESAVNTGIDTNLLRNVKKFLRSQKLKEQHPMGIAGFVKSKCTSTKFLITNHQRTGKHKLTSSNTLESPQKSAVGKISSINTQHVDLNSANDALSPLVKLLSVNGPNETSIPENGKVFIIHMLPATSSNSTSIIDEKGGVDDEPPAKKQRPVERMEVIESEKLKENQAEEESSNVHGHRNEVLKGIKTSLKYECFYCDLSYSNKNDCAKHMLVHLAATSQHPGNV